MGGSAALCGDVRREPARAGTGAARVGRMSDVAAVAPVVGWARRLARPVAVVAVLLAVADLFRWGNRWYLSTRMADTPDGGFGLLAAAHSALLAAVVWLVVAAVAAVVGWRLRVVRAD